MPEIIGGNYTLCALLVALLLLRKQLSSVAFDQFLGWLLVIVLCLKTTNCPRSDQ